MLAFLYKIRRKTGNKVWKQQIAPSIDQKLEASKLEISKKYWFINELNKSKRADISQNIQNQPI